jgi:hypothetical protein
VCHLPVHAAAAVSSRCAAVAKLGRHNTAHHMQINLKLLVDLPLSALLLWQALLIF